MATYCNGTHISLGFLLKTAYSILDKYSPLTQVTKKMYKTYSKPRLTKGILASINKNKIYKNFCKAKNPMNLKPIENLLET